MLVRPASFPYPEDQRERVIAYLKLGVSAKSVSAHEGVHLRTVQRIQRSLRVPTAPKVPKQHGRPRKITAAIEEVCRDGVHQVDLDYE